MRQAKTPEAIAAERESYAHTDALLGITERRIRPFGLTVQEEESLKREAALFIEAAPALIASGDIQVMEASADILLEQNKINISKDTDYCRNITLQYCTIQYLCSTMILYNTTFILLRC